MLLAECAASPANSAERLPSLAALILNYNYERYVTEAIESALAQTQPFDEIIVVDDGSTDNSMQAISAYADRLVIVDKPNGGQLTATMAGLARSRADYVYVLDADDLLEPNFVARVRPCLAAAPVKVQCQLTGIDADGKPLVSVFPTYPARYDSAQMRSDNEQIGFYICPPTAGNIYRREFLDRIDLNRLGPHEPLDGPPALAAPYYGEVLTIDRPLARYRVHGRNDSRWDRPDVQLLKGEIDWFFRRWGDVGAMLGCGEPPFGNAKPLYVRERELMMSALGQGQPLLRLVPSFISRLWATHVTGKQKLILTAWALALVAPIPRLRRYLVNARRSPVNRPAAVKRLLSSVLGAGAGG